MKIKEYLRYIYFLIILFVILGLIAILFTFKYEKEPNSPDDTFQKCSSIELNENELLIVKDKTVYCSKLCEGFFSEKNFFLLLFSFCSPCKYIYT
jgi:hypothetical protein